mmetsp:Transcript_40817/g.116938  ORF Transcript_40817/g.116938 Transcript_40817/m.116938 type:complete len:261 (+) Transcript_40817:699-1481(+)
MRLPCDKVKWPAFPSKSLMLSTGTDRDLARSCTTARSTASCCFPVSASREMLPMRSRTSAGGRPAVVEGFEVLVLVLVAEGAHTQDRPPSHRATSPSLHTFVGHASQLLPATCSGHGSMPCQEYWMSAPSEEDSPFVRSTSMSHSRSPRTCNHALNAFVWGHFGSPPHSHCELPIWAERVVWLRAPPLAATRTSPPWMHCTTRDVAPVLPTSGTISAVSRRLRVPFGALQYSIRCGESMGATVIFARPPSQLRAAWGADS